MEVLYRYDTRVNMLIRPGKLTIVHLWSIKNRNHE